MSAASRSRRAVDRAAAERIEALRREWQRAVQGSSGMTRREAQAAGGDVLSARYRRERLTRQLDAAQAAQRAGKAAPTARASLGHRRPGAVMARWSALTEADPATRNGARLVPQGDVTSPRDSSRIGRHWSAVEALAAGSNWHGSAMTPKRFRRLVRGWAPVAVGGETFRLASDPGAVLAELANAQATGVETFSYEAVA